MTIRLTAQQRIDLMRTTMLATLAVTAPSLASAQQITGLYIGGALGYNYLQDVSGSVDKLPGRSSPPLSSNAPVTIGFGGGFAGLAAIGYGVGNGVRLELEGSYRSNGQSTTGKNAAPSSSNSVNTTVNSGAENKYGIMANAYYDINIGQRWLYPYIGVGFGYQLANYNKIGVSAVNIDYGTNPTLVTPSGTIGEVAYQVMVGGSFPITYVPGLSLTAEYRFLGLTGNRAYSGTGNTPYISNSGQYTSNQTKLHVSSDSNHTVLLGLRYAFDPYGVADVNPAPTAPYAAPPVARVPAPASAQRVFLIFFDFDRADLTPRARDVVAEAVRASARIQHTRIEVSGHADRSGDEAYNQRLSRARAEAVAVEMGRWGVPRSVIDIRSFGDNQPLVPTEAGVREPQNRRVEIIYH